MILSQLLLQIGVNSVKEFLGIKKIFAMLDFIAAYADGQILGHLSALHCLDTNSFQCIREIDEGLVTIQLAAESQSTRPGKDAGDGIGGSGLACLVVAEVAGDGTMGRFGFHDLSIGRDQDGGHQAQ